MKAYIIITLLAMLSITRTLATDTTASAQAPQEEYYYKSKRGLPSIGVASLGLAVAPYYASPVAPATTAALYPAASAIRPAYFPAYAGSPALYAKPAIAAAPAYPGYASPAYAPGPHAYSPAASAYAPAFAPAPAYPPVHAYSPAPAYHPAPAFAPALPRAPLGFNLFG
ncbi:hypothetical protein C0J52_15928 [Blattella germanica]|nr:hypothetical protein C0J52_15928 [Blattella germanica]